MPGAYVLRAVAATWSRTAEMAAWSWVCSTVCSERTCETMAACAALTFCPPKPCTFPASLPTSHCSRSARLPLSAASALIVDRRRSCTLSAVDRSPAPAPFPRLSTLRTPPGAAPCDLSPRPMSFRACAALFLLPRSRVDAALVPPPPRRFSAESHTGWCRDSTADVGVGDG